MPALVYGLEPIQRMVEPILAAGQEVQLHLHSFWHDLARGRRDDARFELTDFNALEQRALIETARDLLIAAGAPPPVAFRSGSYAANADTLAALRQLGLRYDSSHNGTEHPWPSALPLDPALIDPVRLRRRHRDSGDPDPPRRRRPAPVPDLRALQPGDARRRSATPPATGTAVDDDRQPQLRARHPRRQAGQQAGARPLRPALRLPRRAIEATMPTARFAALDLAAPPAPPRAAARPPLRTARRMAEQAWGTARYEKPAVGAAMVAVPPLAAFEELVALAGL